jgi:hypothetical protein
VGALVVQAQAAPVPTNISTMTLTRYYANIRFGNFVMELFRSRSSPFIDVTIQAPEATGLIAQVQYIQEVY